MTEGVTGTEQKTQSLPFREMAINFYKQRAGGREPDGIVPFFVATRSPYSGELAACIGAVVEPALISRVREDYILFEVNSARRWGLAHEKDVNKRPLMRGFEVYDFDVDKLSDPAVVENLIQIASHDVPTPGDNVAAGRIHSWITDPHVRSRVNEYYQATMNEERPNRGGYGDVEKYIKLRNAPFEKSNAPGYGRYTYHGVREEATRKIQSVWDPNKKQMVDKPITFRMFIEEDLAWLETYMRNKGIPIPQE